MKALYPVLFLICLSACAQPQKKENDNKDTSLAAPTAKENLPDTAQQNPAPAPAPASNIEVKTFQNSTSDDANGTWGYDIYIDNNLRFHQPSIPAVAGIRGFSSDEKARIAGDFVANKIKHNILPPAVTPHELDSIGVLH